MASPFQPPASVPADNCGSVCPTVHPPIRCELDNDHRGRRHRNGPLSWHDPILILVGGEEPDLAVNSDHWVDGQVYLTDDEPPL